jgi:hypothetical protein
MPGIIAVALAEATPGISSNAASKTLYTDCLATSDDQLLYIRDDRIFTGIECL